MSDILISGEIINEYLIQNKIIIAIEETRTNLAMEQTSSPMFKGRPLGWGAGLLILVATPTPLETHQN